jgi:hypothetical protein
MRYFKFICTYTGLRAKCQVLADEIFHLKTYTNKRMLFSPAACAQLAKTRGGRKKEMQPPWAISEPDNRAGGSRRAKNKLGGILSHVRLFIVITSKVRAQCWCGYTFSHLITGAKGFTRSMTSVSFPALPLSEANFANSQL